MSTASNVFLLLLLVESQAYHEQPEEEPTLCGCATPCSVTWTNQDVANEIANRASGEHGTCQPGENRFDMSKAVPYGGVAATFTVGASCQDLVDAFLSATWRTCEFPGGDTTQHCVDQTRQISYFVQTPVTCASGAAVTAMPTQSPSAPTLYPTDHPTGEDEHPDHVDHAGNAEVAMFAIAVPVKISQNTFSDQIERAAMHSFGPGPHSC